MSSMLRLLSLTFPLTDTGGLSKEVQRAKPCVVHHFREEPATLDDLKETIAVTQGSDVWLANRTRSVGSSEVSIFAGHGSYDINTDKYKVHAGFLSARGSDVEPKGMWAMDHGHYWEKFAARLAARAMGYTARAEVGYVRSRAQPYAHTSPDRICLCVPSDLAKELNSKLDGDSFFVLVEIKAPIHTPHIGVPYAYVLQMQDQLDIVGEWESDLLRLLFGRDDTKTRAATPCDFVSFWHASFMHRAPVLRANDVAVEGKAAVEYWSSHGSDPDTAICVGRMLITRTYRSEAMAEQLRAYKRAHVEAVRAVNADNSSTPRPPRRLDKPRLPEVRGLPLTNTVWLLHASPTLDDSFVKPINESYTRHLTRSLRPGERVAETILPEGRKLDPMPQYLTVVHHTFPHQDYVKLNP